ncbi:MAG: 2-C-methyl-D-erythritol 2,4-cyclodiphosphate synthase [Pseudomonadota bacterium]|nr:2-C-methyl-D-erythritol 2,4-cyclodiphosphate synthase [Pseudomonadota bacterium]
MTTAALILAGGRGTRAGGDVAKQWQSIAGRPLLDHAVDAFAALPEIDVIALVLPEGAPQQADYAARGFVTATAGADRAGSVRYGLAALAPFAPERVLIHDGARPCIVAGTIRAVLAALGTAPAAAPGLAVTDALWTGEAGQVTGTRDRTGLFAAQTPPGFHYTAICAAHAAHPGGAADDVAVARAPGLPVAIVPGDADNIKVTQPADFARADRIIRSRYMAQTSATPSLPMRLGNGFDVHRFGEGAHVTLCGVEVPHDRGLQGHSDADVGMHAITDAIYGALAEGDIGRHFPPSDPQWKGAASEIFLRHACELAASRGYAVGNVDCTLICEFPKVGPHAGAMQARLAQIMGVDAGAVSVKATTSEKLGFTGRGEGIAANATALLVRV